MPSEDGAEYTDEATHLVYGVGEETKVECPVHDRAYGPGGSFQVDYCPYCGGEVTDEAHRVDFAVSEVFCETTGMSTYRYCPGCGEEVDNVA